MCNQKFKAISGTTLLARRRLLLFCLTLLPPAAVFAVAGVQPPDTEIPANITISPLSAKPGHSLDYILTDHQGEITATPAVKNVHTTQVSLAGTTMSTTNGTYAITELPSLNNHRTKLQVQSVYDANEPLVTFTVKPVASSVITGGSTRTNSYLINNETTGIAYTATVISNARTNRVRLTITTSATVNNSNATDRYPDRYYSDAMVWSIVGGIGAAIFLRFVVYPFFKVARNAYAAAHTGEYTLPLPDSYRVYYKRSRSFESFESFESFGSGDSLGVVDP